MSFIYWRKVVGNKKSREVDDSWPLPVQLMGSTTQSGGPLADLQRTMDELLLSQERLRIGMIRAGYAEDVTSLDDLAG